MQTEKKLSERRACTFLRRRISFAPRASSCLSFKLNFYSQFESIMSSYLNFVIKTFKSFGTFLWFSFRVRSRDFLIKIGSFLVIFYERTTPSRVGIKLSLATRVSDIAFLWLLLPFYWTIGPFHRGWNFNLHFIHIWI